MKKQEKKVIGFMGNTAEIAQALTNIFGQNPDLVVHHTFTSQSVRQVQESGLAVNQQTTYEPVIVVYIVYSNPGDLLGIDVKAPDIKAKMSLVIN